LVIGLNSILLVVSCILLPGLEHVQVHLSIAGYVKDIVRHAERLLLLGIVCIIFSLIHPVEIMDLTDIKLAVLSVKTPS
jgi:hypothetical protein